MSTKPKQPAGASGSDANSAPKKSVARKSKAIADVPLQDAYQLYVELNEVRPKVWRRVLVPVTIELPLLHVVLQLAMDWEDEHLHDFVFADGEYGPRNLEWGMEGDLQDEQGVSLRQALGSRKTFTYRYDFGDDWHHKVKVEKVVQLAAPVAVAVCLEGENACPPEDVGGVYGYEQFLDALADPDDPEHEHYKEWIGGPFDPAAFDVAEVNKRFKKVKLRRRPASWL